MLDYRLEGKVAVLTLNNPDRLNALDGATASQLIAGVERAPGEARAILLNAAGRAFCSGSSLSGDSDFIKPGFDPGTMLEEHYNPMMEALRASPLPVVCAVRGAAAGIGCSLALMGDIIVASDTAYFLQAFRGIGLVPDGGSAFLLSRAIGRTRALEMMLLGERLPAAKALEWGLVTRVFADAELDAEALAMAARLADGPKSLDLIRTGVWAALEHGFTEELARERIDQREAGRTADFREGLAAFLEKRPASFVGG